MKRFAILTAFLALLNACVNNQHSIKITDVEVTHRDDFSSASGITISNRTTCMVGDDIPWILFFDDNQTIFDTLSLTSADSLNNGRLPHYLKPDYEAMEITEVSGHREIIVISSGSDKITRDTAIIVNPDTRQIIKKNIRPLMEAVKIKAGFPEGREINIEGIAVSDKNVYLLHRGNLSGNIIIEIPALSFIKYIKSNSKIPKFRTFSFNLPAHNNVVSGFSGATMLPDKSAILFTASMEDMADEKSDGDVLGSYVGIIPLSGLIKGECFTTLLTDNGTTLPKKLEGIAVSKIMKNNKLKVITVCDNDNGTSDIISFDIELN